MYYITEQQNSMKRWVNMLNLMNRKRTRKVNSQQLLKVD